MSLSPTRILRLDAPAPFPSALGAALGVQFIVPFLVYLRPPPIADFYTEWFAAVLFAVTTLAAIAAVPRSFRVTAGAIALPLVLALLIAVQLALGRYTYVYDWVVWLAYLGAFALAMFLGQGLRSAGFLGEVTHRLAWAILLTALLQLFTQLAQLFRMEDAFAPFIVHSMGGMVCRVHGNIGQANQATAMAWFGIAAALYLAANGRLARVLGVAVVALLLLSSALTASRMAWLFATVVAAAVFWRVPQDARPRARRLAGAALLLIAFAGASVLAAQMIHAQDATCADGLSRLANESGSFAVRWDLWRQAALAWTAHPWVGGGAGSFISLAYLMDQAPGHQPLDSYAHNALFQLLAEFGAAGAGAAVICLAWGAWSVVARRRELNLHHLLLLTWVAILLVYSMLEFPLWYMHFLVFFGLCVGLLWEPKGSIGFSVAHARAVLAVGVAALLAGSAYAAYDYRKAERAFFLIHDAQAMGALGSPTLNATLDEIDRSTHLYRIHLEYALGARMPMNEENLPAKLAENERLLQRLPIVGPVSRQVLLLAFAGDLDGARRHLRRLLKFAPSSTDEAITDMRRIIQGHPERLAPLGRVLDEELAAAPERRW